MAVKIMHLMHTMFPSGTHIASEVSWRPAVDIYRTPNGWLLKYELAGVRPEDLEVKVNGRRLTVRGERRDWCVGETCGCHMMEIIYSRFERSLELPDEVSASRIQAEHQHGMLLIRIQREENR